MDLRGTILFNCKWCNCQSMTMITNTNNRMIEKGIYIMLVSSINSKLPLFVFNRYLNGPYQYYFKVKYLMAIILFSDSTISN